MAVPDPDGPRAGGPDAHDDQPRPPAATTTPWQPAKGRIYRATGEFDEPQTIPNGFTPAPQPVLPKTKGPWALTHLTTSLTGDILGSGRTQLRRPEKKERGNWGRIAVGMGIGILLIAGASAVTAWLLGMF